VHKRSQSGFSSEVPQMAPVRSKAQCNPWT